MRKLFTILCLFIVGFSFVYSQTLLDSIAIYEKLVNDSKTSNFENNLKLSDLYLMNDAYHCFDHLLIASKFLSLNYNRIDDAKLYTQLFHFHKYNGDIDRAYYCINKAIKIYSEMNDKFHVATSILYLTDVSIEKSKFKSGIEILYYAQDIFLQLKDYNNLAMTEIKLARFYSKIGDTVEAYRILQKFQSRKFTHNEFTNFYNKLITGFFFLENKKYTQSKINFDSAFLYLNKPNLEMYKSDIYKYWGMYFTEVNELDSANFYFDKAYANDSAYGINCRLGDYLTHKSHIFSILNDKKSDLVFCQKAYNLRKKVGYTFYITSSTINLGYAYFNLGKNDLALKYLLEGYKYAIEFNQNLLVLRATKKLSALYVRMKDYSNALKYKEENFAYTEIQNQERSNNEITKLKRIYENENKRLEINKSKFENITNLNTYILLSMFGFIFTILVLIYKNNSKERDNREINLQKKQLQKAIEEITFNKELLQIANQDLDKKIMERTKELNIEIDFRIIAELEISTAQEQLMKSFAKEKEVNITKSNLINMVSHEYRTPLTVILASADLLKLYDRSKSPEKFYMQLNRIIQSVNKMVSLIDNVLIFGNLEREYFELRFTEIDVINVINSIIDDIVIIDQNMHKIEFNPIVSSINFKTDSIIFYHVINNIISNAIKYSSDNTKIEIYVTDTIDTISIIVKDYGIGIPESDLIKVYEPFQRAKNVGTISGTGFGLAIVKNFIDRLNGEIIISSKINCGTSVQLIFKK